MGILHKLVGMEPSGEYLSGYRRHQVELGIGERSPTALNWKLVCFREQEDLFSDISQLTMVSPRQGFLFVPSDGFPQSPPSILCTTNQSVRQGNQAFVSSYWSRY